MLCHYIRLRYVRRKSTPSRQACSEHHIICCDMYTVLESNSSSEVHNTSPHSRRQFVI